ncbi:hypothetical protein OUZ56_018836 [Daphnia magna]|uniref:Uncharacterized protein n=1 Tax=Daphnia magna TaxID=35525 RepID=A0ABQ9Z9Z6_9CRUS|nr:hypothetical protein OUZ56_018836 [Daphnia magna]
MLILQECINTSIFWSTFDYTGQLMATDRTGLHSPASDRKCLTLKVGRLSLGHCQGSSRKQHFSFEYRNPHQIRTLSAAAIIALHTQQSLDGTQLPLIPPLLKRKSKANNENLTTPTTQKSIPSTSSTTTTAKPTTKLSTTTIKTTIATTTIKTTVKSTPPTTRPTTTTKPTTTSTRPTTTTKPTTTTTKPTVKEHTTVLILRLARVTVAGSAGERQRPKLAHGTGRVDLTDFWEFVVAFYMLVIIPSVTYATMLSYRRTESGGIGRFWTSRRGVGGQIRAIKAVLGDFGQIIKQNKSGKKGLRLAFRYTMTTTTKPTTTTTKPTTTTTKPTTTTTTPTTTTATPTTITTKPTTTTTTPTATTTTPTTTTIKPTTTTTKPTTTTTLPTTTTTTPTTTTTTPTTTTTNPTTATNRPTTSNTEPTLPSTTTETTSTTLSSTTTMATTTAIKLISHSTTPPTTTEKIEDHTITEDAIMEFIDDTEQRAQQEIPDAAS